MQSSTEQADVTASEVGTALKAILCSTEFSRSPQLQRFLTFVVNESLAGRSDRLKEYTIGVEVFARPPSYDPRLDSLVRVEAKRLRDLLDQYYQTNGKSDRVRIELPRGSYVPVFHAQRTEAASSESPPRSRWLFALVLVLSTGLLTGLSAYLSFRSAPETTHGRRTVAVLPFENLSGDPENEYLCFGLMDEVTTDLAKHQDLRVIARTSASRFKRGDDIRTIARQLKADALLEGSVSKWGDKVRVTAQLINASDSVHIWADTYERSGSDPLLVQNEVSRDIANAAAGRLIRNGKVETHAVKYSSDPETNRLYWKGAYFRAPIGTEKWRDNLAKSRGFLQQAIARDPQFAAAYSALADVCVTLAYESGGTPSTAEDMTCARQAATRALELDDTLSEAYGVLGTVQFSYDYDHVSAEKSFRRALELNPSDARTHMWYAVALAPQHRLDEAIAQAREAKDLDPLSFATSNHLASITYFTGRYNDAMQLARETLAISPDLAPPHAILGMGYEAHGDFGQAIIEYETALRLAPNHPFLTGRLGHAYASANRRDEAERLLKETEAACEAGTFSDVYTAYIYVGLGEYDPMFQHLDRAFQRHDPDLPFIAVDPIFDRVRGDERFVAMLRRLGLAG